MRLSPEIIEIIIDKIIEGHRLTAIARAASIDRRTLYNLRQRPEFQEAFEIRRFLKIDELRCNLHDLAFNKACPPPTRLKATLEMLRRLDPEDYDPRVRFQVWLDKRDEEMQAANAQKAMEQQADQEEDPRESQALDVALAELMQRRRAAAAVVAKEADDYEEGIEARNSQR